MRSPLLAEGLPRHLHPAARAAYGRRLQQVRETLAAYKMAEPALDPRLETDPSPDRSTLDDEEVLRRSMVRYWPKVASGRATEVEHAEYLQHLLAIENRLTDADDLRFFDAWNQAFEALSHQHHLMDDSSAYHCFLHKYAQALEARLAQVKS